MRVDFTRETAYGSSDSRLSGYCDITPDIKNNRLIISVNATETYISTTGLDYNTDKELYVQYYTEKLNPDDSDSKETYVPGRFFTKKYMINTPISGTAHYNDTLSFSGSTTLIPFKDGSLHIENEEGKYNSKIVYLHFAGYNQFNITIINKGDEIEVISNGHIKVNGAWKIAFPWKKINGVWKRCKIWEKISGIWKLGK